MHGDTTIRTATVIVLHDGGAFPPIEIAAAATGLCRIVWLTGWPGARRSSQERLLSRLGDHLDVSGLPIAEIVTRLRARPVDGIIAFSDAALEPAAEIAQDLGLRFHSPGTAERLRDKFAQRTALAAAGLDVPGTRVLVAGDVDSFDDVQSVGASWPAVLKPRRGTAAADTFIVDGPATLTHTLRGMPPEAEFVLEDFLVDRPGPDAGHRAGMFSVELLVDGPRSEVLALTGRFPLQPPLRESGSFLPADLNAQDTEAAVRTARAAAAALGVEHGILHIEEKLTVDGPRIIEVNGRVGGLVPTLLDRVGGAPILRCALALALGLEPAPPPAPAAGGPVAFYRAWLPPLGESRLAAASGLREISARAEVDRAWFNLAVGDVVDSREGGGVVGYAAAAFGVAAGHAELWPLCAQLDRDLSLTFDVVGEPTTATASAVGASPGVR